MKKLLTLTAAIIMSMAWSSNLFSQDTIRMVWEGGGSKRLIIEEDTTIRGELYNIDWGDGTIYPITVSGNIMHFDYTYANTNTYTVTIGAASSDCFFTGFRCFEKQVISLDVSKSTQLTNLHCQNNQLNSLDVSSNTNLIYLDCGSNQLSSLDISSNTSLISLYCDNNQLSSLNINSNTNLIVLDCGDNPLSNLDISNNTNLRVLYCGDNQLSNLDISNNPNLAGLWCQNNQLPLSDLYAVSEQISNVNDKYLGTQRLPIQVTMADMAIDFSSQVMFGGVATVFNVTKGGVPATVDVDYTINNGIIVFLNTGSYTVTMTNAAIVSQSSYPAQVIAEIFISGVNIPENTLKGVEVYPNPATTQLYVKLAEPQTAAYSICNLMGQVVASGVIQNEEAINVSALSAGVYLVKVHTDKGVVTRKVMVSD